MGRYTYNITVSDDSAVERIVDGVIQATGERVSYSVVRRYGGQVIFALTGSRRAVEQVVRTGADLGMW